MIGRAVTFEIILSFSLILKYVKDFRICNKPGKQPWKSFLIYFVRKVIKKKIHETINHASNKIINNKKNVDRTISHRFGFINTGNI